MNTEGGLAALRQTINQICGGLEEDDWNAFESVLQLQSLDANVTVLQAGHPSGCFWIIASGLIRNAYLTEDGKEFNKAFIPAPGFCGAMSEWVTGQAARYSIHTMTPVFLVRVPMSWLRQAVQERPAFARLMATVLSELAWRKERREAAFLLDDATTRYQQCIRELGDLAEHIPAYHLASYLGITEVAISRIKRRLRESGEFPFDSD